MNQMKTNEPLLHGHFYHIYNRGTNGENLFKENANYKYFLDLYNIHLEKYVETYAWALMKNHFHLLVKIKEVGTITPDRFSKPVRCEEQKPPHQHFSNLFNAYTKAINKRHNRHGSLFERPFKRKHIEDHTYLTNLLLYIHNNPVHHGFCEHPKEYPWTSYLSCISNKPTKLQRETAIEWFDNEANFKTCHQDKVDVIEMEKWLGL